MVIPLPLPDEIINGYIGRLRILNGLRSDQETYSRLRAHVIPSAKDSSLASLQLISRVTSLPLHRLIADHTLIPFMYAYGGTEGRTVDCAGVSFCSLRIRTAARKEVYLCENCAFEDVQFHGFSYWRRTHQLPGVNWCVKHGTSLHKCTTKDVYGTLPAGQIRFAEPFASDYIDSIRSNSVIQRYVEICCAYLDHHEPKSTLQFSRRLREMTHSGRTHYRARLESLKLSEMALERLPLQWLRINFPKIADLGPNKWLSSLDGIVSAACNNFATANYALAAALGAMDDIAIFQNSRDWTAMRRSFRTFGKAPTRVRSRNKILV